MQVKQFSRNWELSGAVKVVSAKEWLRVRTTLDDHLSHKETNGPVMVVLWHQVNLWRVTDIETA
jgi:hypothetical protein